MAIGITEEHEALRDSAHDLLERRCAPAAVRAAIGAAANATPSYWPDAAALGWFGLHVPEELGGAGFGLADLAVVVEELGRSAAPGGFVPTVHAAAVLALEGGAVAKDLLPGIVDGSRVATVALGITPVVASSTPAGLELHGVARPVVGATTGGLVLLPVAVDGTTTWCVVDLTDRDVTVIEGLDPTRHTTSIDVEGVAVAFDRILATTGEEIKALGAAIYAAEACGMASWCLDTAAKYARERVQFGRPIGTFQAIKHKCADLLSLVEQMRSLTWDAALAGAVGDEGSLAVVAAGAVVFDGAVKAAEECIQILGGIGFTWEHDAHLYLRRALAVRQLLGPTSSYRARAADLAIAGVRRTQDVELPPEAETYRSEVRAFLDSIKDVDKAERRKPIVDAGYLVPHYPKPWGRDAGPVEQIVIDQEFRTARVRRPTLAIAAWVVPTLLEHGSQTQVERWVPSTMYGELSWCQLFSEPGAGSDLASLTTKAERTDGGWLINGQKVWTSLARQSTHGILLARTTPLAAGDRHSGISYFILDMTSPGIDIRPLREITGQEMFNEVFLDNVFIPDDCLVGEVNDGWRLARTTLVNERVSMATGASFGAGVDGLLKMLAGRDVDPVTLDRLGGFIAEAQSLSLLGLRSTLRTLGGSEKGSESSLRKLLVAEHEQRVQEFGIELLGAEGATQDGEAAGWTLGYLATRCLTIAGGTSEVQRNVIGERLLGLPRDAG
jgi:alkylation response protein AidB-like acyl-CoA dehydrogenase